MKILLLNLRDHKHPRAGGAERFTHEVAKRWVAAGHAVTIIASHFKSGAQTELVDGVRIIRLGNYFTVRWKARQYYKKHFKGKCDVVVDEYTNIPFLAPRFAREPVILLVFEVIGKKYIFGLPPVVGHIAHHWIEPYWYRSYRDVKTVTISESTRDDLLTYGLTNVDIVPIGPSNTPVQAIPSKEERPTLLYVGLLKKANLVDHAIKAFQVVESEIPEARLWIVGRGSELERLKRLANGSQIRFFGFVSDAYKVELMQRAHAVLVPGVREGWGLVITEANACGTPAIGYNIAGHRDSVRDQETGLLTETTPEAMAEAAIGLLRDSNRRERLSTCALDWSRQFSWDKTAYEFIGIIEKCRGSAIHEVPSKHYYPVPSPTHPVARSFKGNRR